VTWCLLKLLVGGILTLGGLLFAYIAAIGYYDYKRAHVPQRFKDAEAWRKEVYWTQWLADREQVRQRREAEKAHASQPPSGPAPPH
jgi:hypothetical protein